MAKFGDGFWCAFGRDDELLPAINCLPDMRHREQTGAKPICVHELPFGTMQKLGLGQLFRPSS